MKTLRILTIAWLFILLVGCEYDPVEPYTGTGVTPPSSNTAAFKIENPKLGEKFFIGDTLKIQWMASNYVKKINLQLYRKTEFKGDILLNAEPNGEFLWEISNELKTSVHYRLKISNSENYEEYQYGNYFVIQN